MTKYTKSIIDGETELEPLFSLGKIFVSDFLLPDENPKYPAAELALAFDPVSKLVQLTEQPCQEAMWGSFYWYKSKTNPSMVAALKNLADSTISKIEPSKKKEIFLDIASNDGTLLSHLDKEKFIRVGIDPSDYPECAANCDYSIKDYFSAAAVKNHGFDNIRYATCAAMFYDLNSPKKFLLDVREILADDGIFVLQLSYTPAMILQTEFGNICFPKDTIINGINKPIQDVKIGDFTYNQHGEKVKIKRLYKNLYENELVCIKPTYLEEICATKEHPILTISKENLKEGKFQNKSWKKAKEICINDYLVVPKIKESSDLLSFKLSEYSFSKMDNTSKVDEFTVNEDIAWLFGIWTAEGSTNQLNGNSSINFTLNRNEIEYQERICKILKSEFDYSCKFYSYDHSGRENTSQGSCSFKRLAHFLNKEFGDCAKNKHIPAWLMSAPQNIKISYLKGLFEGDGFYKNSQIHLHSISKVLCLQVQLILASMGAMTGISWADKSTRIKKDGSIINSSESWQIRGKSKKISEIFGLDDAKNRKNSFYYFEDRENIYVKISRISQKAFKGDVFNFETETNTYMVSNCVVHNCHEHLCYYNLTSLKYLFDKVGFKIQDVEINTVNGGSIRVFLQKEIARNNFSTLPDRDCRKIRVDSILAWEESAGFNGKQIYLDFYQKILDLKKQTVEFIKGEKSRGKSVFGYGSSTKSQTLYQFFGLTPDLITAVSEKQECKFGRKMVGTNIPIISDEEMRKIHPDYLLVGPWFFVENFREREKEYLKNGGKFILPAPKFSVD